ncbi:MAG: tetratricopeptide repeat protein [Gemmatimonadales bacterium]
MTISRRSGASINTPGAADHLSAARAAEREGNPAGAMTAYGAAIATAERTGDLATLSEALRRVSILYHQQNQPGQARALGRRSYEVARALGHDALAAEALNTLGAVEFERGQMQAARELLGEALTLGQTRPDLLSRIEQNLGIIATIQGDHAAALRHYRSSLAACEAAGDDKGRAIAYHNLGMISADQREWPEAERYYLESLRLAEASGDQHLQGLCRLNHAEVHLARQAYELARESAEAALAIFDRMGSRLDKSDAYRVLGVVYRETGRQALAEARLSAAIESAVSTGAVLSEAEASRELARLYQAMGRNQEALTLLNRSHGLFHRLDAHLDLVDVQGKVEELEGTYLAVVRDWGQSIESADSYTHGHCERVARYAEQVARALGLDAAAITTIRLGAYLHDLGKVKVPHEILNKPGKLTDEEFAIIKMHPVWGVELLEEVEFPWDLKPIIRWHHEKQDGSGYPDRLAGDAIPLGAAIIGIVDVYDALTTTRSYRGAMSHEEALARMSETSHWWRREIFEAFMRTVGVLEALAA